VRLSPKSVFVGLIILGLPFAMVLGWRLADHPTTPGALRQPAGAGAFGAAPVTTRTATSAPTTRVDYWPDAGSDEVAATAPATPTTEPPVTRPIPSPVATAVTSAGLPPLGAPPVPTPTEVPGSASPSVSLSPTPSESADPPFQLFNRAPWFSTP
jgi:hypothetical protein